MFSVKRITWQQVLLPEQQQVLLPEQQQVLLPEQQRQPEQQQELQQPEQQQELQQPELQQQELRFLQLSFHHKRSEQQPAEQQR